MHHATRPPGHRCRSSLLSCVPLWTAVVACLHHSAVRGGPHVAARSATAHAPVWHRRPWRTFTPGPFLVPESASSLTDLSTPLPTPLRRTVLAVPLPRPAARPRPAGELISGNHAALSTHTLRPLLCHAGFDTAPGPTPCLTPYFDTTAGPCRRPRPAPPRGRRRRRPRAPLRLPRPRSSRVAVRARRIQRNATQRSAAPRQPSRPTAL